MLVNVIGFGNWCSQWGSDLLLLFGGLLSAEIGGARFDNTDRWLFSLISDHVCADFMLALDVD